jgi:catechol 2,3-dioxygenase-like lactoylglutathione lyase family enzyme
MLDHVTIGVSDLERSKAFYDKALKAIGIERLYSEGAEFFGYGALLLDRSEPFGVVHLHHPIAIRTPHLCQSPDSRAPALRRRRVGTGSKSALAASRFAAEAVTPASDVPDRRGGEMHRAAQRGRVAVALEQLRLYTDPVLRDLSSKGFVTSCKCREI